MYKANILVKTAIGITAKLLCLQAKQLVDTCFLSLAGLCSLQASKETIALRSAAGQKAKRNKKTLHFKKHQCNFKAADTCYWCTAGGLKVNVAVVLYSLAA